MTLVEAIVSLLKAIFGGKKKSSPAPAAPVREPQMFTNASAFFARLRQNKILGPTLEQSEVDGINFILKACYAARWPISWVAYALATTFHETAGKMQPIKEYGSVAYLTRNYDVTGKNPSRARKMGNMQPGDGVKYCGRGYVQLTWKTNYRNAGIKLGVNLVDNPDLALSPPIAARILVEGMREGWFTGCDIDDDLPRTNTPASLQQFQLSRDIINGKDKALKIAEEAVTFQEALQAGGWQMGA